MILQAPISGTVLEINEALSDSPSMVNESAMQDGWFIKIKLAEGTKMDGLLDQAAYDELIKE